MPGILDANQIGKREFLMGLLFLADARKTVFLSTARKSKSAVTGKKGLPNMLGTYNVKVLGDRKAGGVADGKDVGAFDGEPPRQQLAFRAEKYRRAPMVGDIAEGNDVAGVEDEFAAAVADQLKEHARDMEAELLSDQDSSANGGLENGSTQRGLGRWVNAGELAISDPNCPIPSGARTPTAQVYTGVIGDGVTTGLLEQTVQDLLQNRWDSTGDSGELMGFVGATIKNRFGLFSRYTPSLTGATPNVQTISATYQGGTFYGPTVDVYKSDWGGFTLMPVNTTFLPNAKRAYFLDMSMVEVRSRYWCREKDIPDLGGGPRELIESIIALIPGDLRSHVKIAAT